MVLISKILRSWAKAETAKNEDYLLQSKDKRNNLAMLKMLCLEYALPDKYKGIFLALASSGLRVSELLGAEIDANNRMLIPEAKNGSTKHAWVSFYNEESAALLEAHKSKYI